MSKPRRVPPLTPEKVAEQMRRMQALYGDRALPKDPLPAEPGKGGKA